MNDHLINRWTAIEALRRVEALTMENIIYTMRTLPSAQIKPQWILVSERLSEIDMSHPHHEDYFVQYDSGGIDVASWSNVNRF